MSADLQQTVRKILLLEQRRRYDDGAVVGGLAAFLAGLTGTIRLTENLWERVRGYREQTPADRSPIVASILAALDQSGPGNDPVNQSLAPGSAPPDPPSTTLDRPTLTAADQPIPVHPASPPSPVRPAALRRPSAPTSQLKPQASVAALSGVGPTRAKRLAAMGIETVHDLRLLFPNRYIAYPPPQPAASLGFQHLASFEGEVRRVDIAHLPGKRMRITATLGDATGTVAAVWIRSGVAPPGIHQGARLAVSGPLVAYGRQVYFENPEYEPADDPPLNTRATVPVYPLTRGLTQPFVRGAVRQALDRLPPLEEWLPPWLQEAEQLLGRDEALHELHRPSSDERLEEARQRFAFDELLPIQLRVLQRRHAYQAEPAHPINVAWGLLAEFRQQLPFALTGAQQRVLSAILEDVAQPRPMVRLLQGEVGSGKTVVAAMAVLATIASGGQAAILAPTEILAEQHHRTLVDLYGRAEKALEIALGRRLRVDLMTGALGHAEREQILASLARGETDLVVGTHAVIQSDVEFARLWMAVVDEQHRFGVGQRVALRRKGSNPHLLVMTATPIPRTLALTLYGDLDVSVVDEMPVGRQPVETSLLYTSDRGLAYEAVRTEVAAGHQAFIICPLVEDSPALEVRAATTEYERLQRGELAGLRLALLHGRMRPAEKDETMRAFGAGQNDVLVSTSVVEVGIDVPNATVMVIEGAERFGLAQLHQFRGRIGRGSASGKCFLVAASESPDSLERLEAVVRSTNGLELADEDLRNRGPGDYFGVRQSGLPTLHMARLTDLDAVQRIREAAARLLEHDPGLSAPEHAALAAEVARLGDAAGEAN